METPTKKRVFVLKSVDGTGDDLEVTVEGNGLALCIKPKGFGDNGSEAGHGCPLLVENRGGVSFVCVWDDINREDSSHIISLEKAAEDKYGKMACHACGDGARTNPKTFFLCPECQINASHRTS